MSARTNFVMIGNPGVGKSTILNALVGDCKFESGISFGSGLTTVCQRHVAGNGMVYIDTPGLSDVEMRKKAAEEITIALKSSGYFKIFFVITLEAGRARPDDLTTIKLVVNSAPIKTDYSIIVNKMDKNLYAALSQGNNREKLETSLNKDLPGTSSIYYNEEVEGLKSVNNVLHQLPSALAKFILAAPIITILAESVTPIKEDAYEEMRKQFGAIIEKLEKNQEFLMKALEDERERSRKAQEEYNNKQQELQKNYNTDLKNIMKQHAQQLKKVGQDNTNKVSLPNPDPQVVNKPSQSNIQTTNTSPSPSSSSFGKIAGSVLGGISNVLLPGSGPYVSETISNWLS